MIVLLSIVMLSIVGLLAWAIWLEVSVARLRDKLNYLADMRKHDDSTWQEKR